MKKMIKKYANGKRITLGLVSIAMLAILFTNPPKDNNESLVGKAVNGILSATEKFDSSNSLSEKAVDGILLTAKYTTDSEQLDVIEQKLRYMNAVRIANEVEMYDKVLNQKNMNLFIDGSEEEKVEFERMISVLENIDEKYNQE